MKIKFLFILLSGLILTASAQTMSNRFALVIGVKDYEFVPPLKNSVNDAQDMAVTLKGKGFIVTELYNPKTKREMQDAIRSYFNLLNGKKDATSFVFYSGHSMQVDGINYFMPTTANPQLQADLDDQSLKMEYLLSVIEQAGNSLNIFILDACRNNPFRGFTRSAEQGLSQVNAPKGSYVVYATAPGSVASDGTGRNGLFTSKLLKYINTSGVALEQVFKYVARDVQQESNGSQVPWINYSYFGDFYFSGTASVNTAERIDNTVQDNSVPRNVSTLTPSEMKEKGDQYVNKKDYSEAVVWYQKAADLGSAAAQFELGYMYSQGRGVTQNHSEALFWYHKAAEKGDLVAQYNIGVHYLEGRGVPKDYTLAMVWFRKAADQNHDYAQLQIGSMYANGLGVPQDNLQAVYWLQKSAEQNNMYGQRNLAIMYFYGRGVAKDEAEAVKWYHKAADQGDAQAQNSLGIGYENGNGVMKDIAEAIKWYKLAAAQGYKPAQENLDRIIALQSTSTALAKSASTLTGSELNTKGDEYYAQNKYSEAFEMYSKSAEKGYAYGQANLGYMYMHGRGVTTDYNQAMLWERKAADQGNLFGQDNLGTLYERGLGLPKDDVQAAFWYRKAADQNFSSAQNSLAEMYESGRGVPKDIALAVTWYKKSVAQGFGLAQINLGLLYELGLGVSKDLNEAIRLYKLAAAQDYKSAQSHLERLNIK